MCHFPPCGIAQLIERPLLFLIPIDGRVGMWRGGFRLGLSVSATFVWRCLINRAMAPFADD